MPMTSDQLQNKLIEKINELVNFQTAGQYTAGEKTWQDIHNLIYDINAVSFNEGLKTAEMDLKKKFSLQKEMYLYVERKKNKKQIKQRAPSWVWAQTIKEIAEQTKDLPIYVKKNAKKRNFLTVEKKYVKNYLLTKTKKPIKKFEN